MPHKVSDKLKHRINYSRTPIETIPMGKWNKHFEQIFSSKQKVQTNLQLVPEYIGVSIVGGVCIGSGSQWFLAMIVINWSLLSTWLWQKSTWSSSYPISWLSSFSIIMQEVNLGKLCVTELGKHRLEGGLESVNFLIMGGAWGSTSCFTWSWSWWSTSSFCFAGGWREISSKFKIWFQRWRKEEKRSKKDSRGSKSAPSAWM